MVARRCRRQQALSSCGAISFFSTGLPPAAKTAAGSGKQIERVAFIDRIETTERYDATTRHRVRRWRNWQTRQLEGLVGATPWRFESSSPHQF